MATALVPHKNVTSSNVNQSDLGRLVGALNNQLTQLGANDSSRAQERIASVDVSLRQSSIGDSVSVEREGAVLKVAGIKTDDTADRSQMFARFQAIDNALQIALGKVIAPTISNEQQVELKARLMQKYSVGTEDGKLQFTVPQGMSTYSACLELFSACRALGRNMPAFNQGNYEWLLAQETKQNPLTQPKQESFSFGYKLKAGNRCTATEQKHLLAREGLELPSREIAILAHAIEYFRSGKDIFNGFIIRTDNGEGLRASNHGVEYVFGHVINMFGTCMGVKRNS